MSGVPALSWGGGGSGSGSGSGPSGSPTSSSGGGSISARYHSIHAATTGAGAGSGAGRQLTTASGGSMSARGSGSSNRLSQSGRVQLPSVAGGGGSGSVRARKSFDLDETRGAWGAAAPTGPLVPRAPTHARAPSATGRSSNGNGGGLHDGGGGAAMGAPILSPIHHDRSASLSAQDGGIGSPSPRAAGHRRGASGSSRFGTSTSLAAVAVAEEKEKGDSEVGAGWEAASVASSSIGVAGDAQEDVLSPTGTGALLSPALFLAELAAAATTARGDDPNTAGGAATGAGADADAGGEEHSGSGSDATRAFLPLLSRQASRLDRQLRLGSTLLSHASRCTRTAREAQTVTRLGGLVETIVAEERALAQCFGAEVSRSSAGLLGAQQLASSYASLQSKLAALDFDSWSSQHALHESVAALEDDIRRLGATGVAGPGAALRPPPYQHGVHPVANLVAKKFARLEQIIFMLKRQLAATIENGAVGRGTAGAHLANAGDEAYSGAPVAVDPAGAGAGAAGAFSSPPHASSLSSPKRHAATVGAAPAGLDASVSAILAHYGSVDGMHRENEALRRRNAALTRALAALRSSAPVQAAMGALPLPERKALNDAVTPSLAQGLATASADLASLRPAVYALLASYDALLLDLFDRCASGGGGGGADVSGHVGTSGGAEGVDGILRAEGASSSSGASRSITLASVVSLAREVGIVPRLMTGEALAQLAALCRTSCDFIVAPMAEGDGIRFHEFKELLARVALAQPTAPSSSAAATPLAAPTQVERVRALLYELDCTAQEWSYGWFETKQHTRSHTHSGIMSLLDRHDRPLRTLFQHYGSLVPTTAAQVIRGVAAQLRAPNAAATATPRNSKHAASASTSASGPLVVGAGLGRRTMLALTPDSFLRFCRDFSVAPDLIDEAQCLDQFHSSATTYPAPIARAPGAANASDADIDDSQSVPLLLYPEFKLLVARLALAANSSFPSLDPRALFDLPSVAAAAAAADGSDAVRAGLARRTSVGMSSGASGTASVASFYSSRSFGSGDTAHGAGGSMDPTHTLVAQFLSHLHLTEACADGAADGDDSALRQRMGSSARSADEEGSFEHRAVDFDAPSVAAAAAAASVSTAAVGASSVPASSGATPLESALWSVQEHARQRIRAAGQRARESARDRSDETSLGLGLGFGLGLSPSPLANSTSVSSDHEILHRFRDTLPQLFGMYARSLRAPSGAPFGYEGPAAVRAVGWADFEAFLGDFSVQPGLLPAQARTAAAGQADADADAPSSGAAAAVPDLRAMFVAAAQHSQSSAAVGAGKKGRGGRSARALQLDSFPAPSSSAEPLPLTYSEFCRLLVRVGRAVPLDGYSAARRLQPAELFLEFLASRFEYPWVDAKALLQCCEQQPQQMGPPIHHSIAQRSQPVPAEPPQQSQKTSARIAPSAPRGAYVAPSAAPAAAQEEEEADEEEEDEEIGEEEEEQTEEEMASERLDGATTGAFRVSLATDLDTNDEHDEDEHADGEGDDGGSSDALAAFESSLSASGRAAAAATPSLSDRSAAPEVTFAWLKPDLYASGDRVAEVLERVAAEGFEVVLAQEHWLSEGEVDAFYSEHAGKPFFPTLRSFMTSAPCLALALRAHDAVARWRALMGPTDSARARREAPRSLRALYGTDGSRNATHGSDSVASAAREVQMVFSRFACVASSLAAPIADVAPVLLTILPDAVGEGRANAILDRLRAEEDVEVLAYEPSVALSRAQVERVHRWHPLRLQAEGCARQIAALEESTDPSAAGALSASATLSPSANAQRRKQLQAQSDMLRDSYAHFIDFMSSSGPVALVLLHVSRDALASGAFASLVGPADPVEARATHPHSLRALHGSSPHRNGLAVQAGIGVDLAQTLRDVHDLLDGMEPTIQSSVLLLNPGFCCAGSKNAGAAHVTTLLSRLASAAPDLQIEQTSEVPIRNDVRKVFFSAAQARAFVECDPDRPESDAYDLEAKIRGGDASTEEVTAAGAGQHCVALRVRGMDGVRALRLWLHSPDSSGLSPADLAHVHCSRSSGASVREGRLLFDTMRPGVESTLALVKPDATASGFLRHVLARAAAEGFQVVRQEECVMLDERTAMELVCGDQQAQATHPPTPAQIVQAKFLTSGPMVALELRRSNAVEAWHDVVGESMCDEGTLKSLLATDTTRDAIHAPRSRDEAARQLDLLFRRTVPLVQSTLALLKPDVTQGVMGAPPAEENLLRKIAAQGFDVVRSERVVFTEEQVRALFEGRAHCFQQQPLVIERPLPGRTKSSGGSLVTPSPKAAAPMPMPPQPSFDEFSVFMRSGPVVAMELRREQAVRTLKQLAGGQAGFSVLDPSWARREAPLSLRGSAGTNALRNAVHASTSYADAQRELRIVFGRGGGFFPPVDDALLLLKHDQLANAEAVATRVREAGLQVLRQKKLQLSPAQVEQLCPVQATAAGAAGASDEASLGDSDGDAQSPGSGGAEGPDDGGDPSASVSGVEFVRVMSSRSLVAMHVSGPDAVTALQRLCGLIGQGGAAAAGQATGTPSDASDENDGDSSVPVAASLDELRLLCPTSLRAQYARGSSSLWDGFHCSASHSAASRELELVFHTWFPETNQSTLALLKPDLYAAAVVGARGTPEGRGAGAAVAALLARIKAEGFEIVRQARLCLSEAQARALYVHHAGRIFLPQLAAHMASGASLALELRRTDAVATWRRLIGPADPSVARAEAPNTLRALHGSSVIANGVHGSATPAHAARELALVFGEFVPAIQDSCCVLKPEVASDPVARRKVLAMLRAKGFDVVKQEKQQWSGGAAMRFYASHAGALYYRDLVAHVTSGPVLALHLRKEQAVESLRALLGPTDAAVARRTQPNSLRALFGVDKKRNGLHASASVDVARRELDLVFGELSAGVQQTFAFIRPDLVADQARADEVLARVEEEGFVVQNMLQRTLSRAQAQEFFAPVVAASHKSQSAQQQKQHLAALVQLMSSGPCIALVLQREGAVAALQELCGPADPAVARSTAPDSLRALYGTDALRNGLHVSASVEDATREIALVTQDFFVGVQRTVALIQPDAVAAHHDGAILEALRTAGFEVVRKRALALSVDQARLFCEAAAPTPAERATSAAAAASDADLESRVAFLASGACIIIELRRDDAVRALQELAGPIDVGRARSTAPNSLRALYGSPTDPLHTGLHCSLSAASASREASLLFERIASSLSTVVAIVKADAVKRGAEDEIAARLVDEHGFELIARKKLRLTPAQARALHAHEASKSTYKQAVEHAASGPVVCLALRRNGALPELQAAVGPENPRLAKKTHPNSLRALFGTDSVRNGVHCPDSMESNARDIALLFDEYNFDLLG